MGRKSKLTDAQWDEIEDVAFALNSISDDEKSVILQLKIMLFAGDLRRHLGVSRINRYRFEYYVGFGRIDLILFHSDMGITIIEAKSDCHLRTIASGIGQLCVYESLLKRDKSIKAKYINKILCAPVVSSEKGAMLIDACNIAGVKFTHMAPYNICQEQIAAIGR